MSSASPQENWPPARKTITSSILLGTFAGLILGVADPLEVIAGGWTEPLGGLGTAQFAAAACVVLAALGAVVGLMVGIGLVAANRLGIGWVADHGLLLGARTVLTAHQLPVAVGAWAILAFCVTIRFIMRILPFGVPMWAALTGAALAGSIIMAVALVMQRRSMRTAWIAWLLWAAVFYFLETRLLYHFSKLFPMSLIHLVGLVHMIVFLMLAFTIATPALWRRLQQVAVRVPVALLALAVLVLLAARPALALGSNRLRLALHERTTLTYRVLRHLPGGRGPIESVLRDAGCGDPTQIKPAVAPVSVRPRQPARVRGVLLMFVDTLRGDHVVEPHCDDDQSLTPELAKFAKNSTRFSRAYCVVPMTQKSLAALVSSRMPNGIDQQFLDQHSLGPQLRKHGIKSVSLSLHQALWPSTHMFDSYDKSGDWLVNKIALTSETTVTRTIEALKQLGDDEKFFLLTHFYDPHNYYLYNPLFPSDHSEKGRYDAEVAFTDHWIGKLLDYLQTSGLDKEIAVVIVGDHGDEFYEHRYWGHRVRLYEESTRVAMLMRAPGVSGDHVVDVPVSLLDVTPTVLELLGVPVPVGMIGQSLLPTILRQGQPSKAPVYMHAENANVASIIAGNRKLIFDRDAGIIEYYDLAADPTEQWNLADQRADEVSSLACPLAGWMSQQGLW